MTKTWEYLKRVSWLGWLLLWGLVCVPVITVLVKGDKLPDWVKGVIAWLWGALFDGLAWIDAPVTVGRWWFWLSLAAVVACVAVPAWGWITERRKPAWKSLTQYTLYDTVWKWSWGGGDYPTDLAPHCPKCKLELTHVNGYHSFGGQSAQAYWLCTSCGDKLPPVERAEVRKWIKREVERLGG